MAGSDLSDWLAGGFEEGSVAIGFQRAPARSDRPAKRGRFRSPTRPRVAFAPPRASPLQ